MTAPQALIEWLDHDGHPRLAAPVHGWPASVGRAIDNTLVVDDPHLAARHLVLDADDAGVFVRVGETRNGVRHGSARLAAGDTLRVGDAPLRLDIGSVALRVRLASHALAPEQPLATRVALTARPALAVLLALLALAAFGFTAWLDTDPGAFTRALVSQLQGIVVAAMLWCGVWALVSKLFTRRTHAIWHATVLFGGVFALQVLQALANLLAFAFSWPALSSHAYLLLYVVAGLTLFGHLLGVEPRRLRGPALGGLAVALVMAGFGIWGNWKQNGRLGSELYMTHLFPPSLRLAPARSPEALVQRLAPLEASLDRKARERDVDTNPESLDDE